MATSPYGLFTFVLVTLILGGLGAWAAGRAMAQTWRPMAMIALYMLFLGGRLHHYALSGEPLLSLQFFLVAYVWNLLVGGLRLPCLCGRLRWPPSIPGPMSARGANWRAKSRG